MSSSLPSSCSCVDWSGVLDILVHHQSWVVLEYLLVHVDEDHVLVLEYFIDLWLRWMAQLE